MSNTIITANDILRAKADYDAVYHKGYAVGKAEGELVQGTDKFWDDYQSSGSRVDYNYGFSGAGWTNSLFKPKYDIKPTKANSIFYESQITDLKGLLEDLGITLDFSNCTAFTYITNGSKITRLGTIDTRKTSTLDYLLYGSINLTSVDKIILRDTGAQSFTSTYSFGRCTKLSEIRFDGVIGKSINFKDCPLSVDSMIDIISHLKWDWTMEEMDTRSITFSETCWSALENSGRYPNDDPDFPRNWREYVRADLGWLT